MELWWLFFLGTGVASSCRKTWPMIPQPASRIAIPASLVLAGITFVAGFAVSLLLHEPIPRVHDEFSYTLMGDTLAHGRVANPGLPLPEFFDTFHVLTQPVYASKYFPAQGVFLAIGEIFTGHQAVGVWLSSALACAATYWMLEGWIGPGWALLGGFLMVVQYGVFSYWSQSYWGGMVAALGGALAFGAARRLWDRFSWKSSAWLGLGIVILVNSRPLEGFIAMLPVTTAFTIRFLRGRLWQRTGFLWQFLLPTAVVFATGAFLTTSYNRAITGSRWKPPYLLHEQQYQESPQFTFLPLRPKKTYSSPWVQYYYEVYEMNLYEQARMPKYLIPEITMKLKMWWGFFCGFLLTPAFVIPPLLRKGRIGYVQAGVLIAFIVLFAASAPQSFVPHLLIDLLVLVQIGVLWVTFDGIWQRIAIASSFLLLLEACVVKFSFPHYFAPAACLILYLQVEGLGRVWQWTPQGVTDLTRSERRRISREGQRGHWLVPRLRGLMYLLPVVCLLSLVLRIYAHANEHSVFRYDPEWSALPMHGWSLHRADLEHWLEQEPGQHLVFVWYSAHHRVKEEWVYNRADLVHAKVIWARNLGPQENRRLLAQFPNTTAWLVDADRRDAQLIPYSEIQRLAAPAPQKASTGAQQDDLN
jgi:hypothetical protein